MDIGGNVGKFALTRVLMSSDVAVTIVERLKQDAVHLFQIDHTTSVAHRLHETSDTEVSHGSQGASGGACNEAEGLACEGLVSERSSVELREDKALYVVRREPLHEHGVRDSALDVLLHSEGKVVRKGRLGHQDQVVVLWEVLQEQAQSAQALDVHEVHIINDDSEHFALAIDVLRLRN